MCMPMDNRWESVSFSPGEQNHLQHITCTLGICHDRGDLSAEQVTSSLSASQQIRHFFLWERIDY